MTWNEVIQTKPVIIDTDIGGDPDDLFAVIAALRSPELAIQAFISSDEHHGHRAGFLEHIVQLAGADVPVFEGLAAPGSKDAYCLMEYVHKRSRLDYAEFVNELTQNQKVTYICIGPQSNIAHILDYGLEKPKNLDVIMMGGALAYRKKGVAEHNIRYDVSAARKVFSSPLKKRYVISDTTFVPELTIDEEHPLYALLFDSNEPLARVLVENMSRFFSKKYAQTIMHDPLTIASVISPDLVLFSQERITLSNSGIMISLDEGVPTFLSAIADYTGVMQWLCERVIS